MVGVGGLGLHMAGEGRAGGKAHPRFSRLSSPCISVTQGTQRLTHLARLAPGTK